MCHGIGNTGKTPLIILDGNLNAHRYIHDILIPVDVPFTSNMGGNAVFQDDNTRPPPGTKVREFMVQHKIQTIEWPACSPDLNPIERLWDQISRAVRQGMNQHNTLLDLRSYPQEEWNVLPQERIQGLINSMRQRCQACVNAQGGATRY